MCSSPFGLLYVDREYPGQRFRNAVISAVRASSPYFEHNNTIFSEMLGEDEEYQRLKKAKRAAEESLQSVISKEAWKQYLSLDEICNELECARYRERQKHIVYPPKESNRDRLCEIIDTILAEKPEDYEMFLQKLEQQGYEVKRGKHTAVKGKGQKRFIRFERWAPGTVRMKSRRCWRERRSTNRTRKSRPKSSPSSCWWTFRGK